MKSLPPIVAWIVFTGAALLPGFAAEPAEPIDWNRARELRQKDQRGISLTPEERAYLARAIAARKGGNPTDGKKAPSPRERTGLIPLNEFPPGTHYQGFEGGLYGEGKNAPPTAHAQAVRAAAARIVPLDRNGRPAVDGKVVLLAVGMSNTTQEFSRFMEIAATDPRKAKSVVLVDGAQGGQTAAAWARSAEGPIWSTVDSRLRAAQVTAQQVQVAWVKQANARPTDPFPTHAKALAADYATLLRHLKAKFPNLQIAYLSSRTYGGYATTALNPEPYAYESAFAVRDVILRQIAGDPALSPKAVEGQAPAPLLLWGPYLWADGLSPRRSDGLIWTRQDFREDGTHPSGSSGRTKVARLLLEFLTTDPTAIPWFVVR